MNASTCRSVQKQHVDVRNIYSTVTTGTLTRAYEGKACNATLEASMKSKTASNCTSEAQALLFAITYGRQH